MEVPSDNVPFNTTPAMKAPEITAAGIEALRSKRYDVRRMPPLAMRALLPPCHARAHSYARILPPRLRRWCA